MHHSSRALSPCTQSCRGTTRTCLAMRSASVGGWREELEGASCRLTGTSSANSVITSILCVSKLKLLTTDQLFQKHHQQKINGAVLIIFSGNPIHRHFLLILLKMFWLMILIYFSLKKIRTIRVGLAENPVELPDYLCNVRPDFTGTPLTDFQPVSEEEVAKTIKSSSSSTCNLDPLPTWLVKSCLSSLLTVITLLVNLSLSTGETS